MEWFLGFTQICQRIPPPESLLLDPGHSLFLCSYHCKIPSLHCLLLIEEVVDGKQHAKAYGDELRLGQTGTLHKVESIPKAVARSHVALNCVDKHFFLHEVWEEFLSASQHLYIQISQILGFSASETQQHSTEDPCRNLGWKNSLLVASIFFFSVAKFITKCTPSSWDRSLVRGQECQNKGDEAKEQKRNCKTSNHITLAAEKATQPTYAQSMYIACTWAQDTGMVCSILLELRDQ